MTKKDYIAIAALLSRPSGKINAWCQRQVHGARVEARQRLNGRVQ